MEPFITEEERLRLKAQALRSDPTAVGPATPAAQPSGMGAATTAGMDTSAVSGLPQAPGRRSKEELMALLPDTSGKQSKMESQRDYAKSLRGKDRLEGRTVGPSGIYVGPNIGDMIASLGEGYLGGRATKKADALAGEISEAEKEAKLAEMLQEEEQRVFENAAAEEQLLYDRKTLETQEERAERKLASEIAAREAATAMDEANTDLAFAKYNESKRREDLDYDLKVMKYEEEVRQFNEGLAQEKEKMDAELEKARLEGGNKYNEAVDKQVTDLTKTLVKEDLPQMQSALDTWDAVVAKYKKEDGTYNNIPGIGGLMNPATSGPALANFADAFGEDAAREVQQALRTVMNAKIKDQSGATVTLQEMFREMAARGISIWDSDEAAVNGIESIRREHIEKLNTIRGGYNDDVLSVYDARRKDRAPTGDGGLTDEEKAELAALEEEEKAGG